MPVVIAHRGASGYRPEHTLESYRLGAEQGADFIEPDLVPTRDGVLVARHENEIGGTTDVAERPEFADRRASKDVGGSTSTGWFTEDFTLAELKTLRARERIPELRPANTAYDGRFEVPTFEEVLDLREELSERLGREVGVYPETKHPAYFRSVGLALEPGLVTALAARGLDRAGAPVLVQSFDAASLQEMRERLQVPLVQLLGRGDERTSGSALAEIAGYAHAVGPSKELVGERFVSGAHDAGLAVHPYTFRRENAFLPEELRSSGEPSDPGDLRAELERYLELGVDGLFTDNPDVAAALLAER